MSIIFLQYIHFAAESHVDNSIDSPDQFINTNVIGTFNLIDVARQYWMNALLNINKAVKQIDFIIFLQMRFMAV